MELDASAHEIDRLLRKLKVKIARLVARSDSA
jgi:hypothetical protein